MASYMRWEHVLYEMRTPIFLSIRVEWLRNCLWKPFHHHALFTFIWIIYLCIFICSFICFTLGWKCAVCRGECWCVGGELRCWRRKDAKSRGEGMGGTSVVESFVDAVLKDKRKEEVQYPCMLVCVKIHQYVCILMCVHIWKNNAMLSRGCTCFLYRMCSL